MVSVKLVVAAFVVAALAAAVAEGQSTPSCALEPCVKYANAMSTPSEACCSPTREMVANEKDSLFTQPPPRYLDLPLFVCTSIALVI
ncbi:hypothetical protein SAY86_001245 [Trapa natans]|uniref:Bifunctional inhibitor/plant lipid transfer protein/seed storage helical domain-containing protein n=1 Tax=Trapa natans TaxID=22666 RepID=A0AAN7RGB4_TRANT|nr:hypothetical protein SAY86_001245 [Trapa natans]